MAQIQPIALSSFDSLPLSEATRGVLASMGISEPTPIQARTLPLLLAGRDVIGQARTGSGKTLAFGIPLVERCRAGSGAAQALVLTPTRELAAQVGGVIAQLGRRHRLRVVELVGGRSYLPQSSALRAGAEIVVGTPGRVIDHLKQGTLRLGAVSYFVLDEADEMLDRGFGRDVERIIQAMSASALTRQNALFSATVPDWARQIATQLLKDPAEVRVDTGRSAAAAPESVEHVIYEVPEGAKPAVLRALLNEQNIAGTPAEDASNVSRSPASASRGAGNVAGMGLMSRDQAGRATLVFGRTRHGVRKLAKQLSHEGYRASALQSDLAQGARERVIAAFRSGEVPILIATNVAARGLDIPDLARVINYDLPENGLLFTHRVGRTGRMGRSGQAITLLAPEDAPKWRQLEKELKSVGLEKPFPRRRWDRPLPHVPSSLATAAAGTPAAGTPAAGTPAAALSRPGQQSSGSTRPTRQPPGRVARAGQGVGPADLGRRPSGSLNRSTSGATDRTPRPSSPKHLSWRGA